MPKSQTVKEITCEVFIAVKVLLPGFLVWLVCKRVTLKKVFSENFLRSWQFFYLE